MSHYRPNNYMVWISTWCLVFLMACIQSVVFAQSTSANLGGTVIDETGAVVPDTQVTISNPATGLQRQVITDRNGSFTFPMLSPGTYAITAQHAGFSPVHLDNIILNTNDQRFIQVQLKVGQASITINVTEEAPLINQSSAVGTVINRQFVGNLPLNGRSLQSLILLTPGVVVASSGIDPGQFSINGQRADANYFTVDGVSANIGVIPGFPSVNSVISQAGTVPGLTSFGSTNNLVSMDALEEFRIQTSSYTAEFGRQPGGQIALVTRSGANQFHGTAFEYLRNDIFDAREYFNKVPARKTPLRQNQFGGTFSGPIVIPGLYDGHNRTFFFFSYEGQRLRLPISGVDAVPSLRLRQLAAPAFQTIMNSWPLPTGPELLSATGQPLGFSPYNYSLTNPSTMDATSIRIDHTVNSKLTLFGRFNESPSSSITHGAGALTTPPQSGASTRTLTLGATSSLTPRLSNELRFNYSRQQGRTTYIDDVFGGAAPIDISALTTGYNGDFNKYSVYYITLGGSSYSTLTLGNLTNSFQRQINLVDNLSLVKGGHQFKFGIDYRRLAPIYVPQEYYPNAYLSTEADIHNGILSSLYIFAYEGAKPLFANFSVYGQDTWKVSRRLTLDLGLRWEVNPAPSEADGKKPATAVGMNNVATATLAPPDAPFYKTFYNAFAPRVGLAYQLKQASGRETVLRGGFGVYYDLGSGQSTLGYVLGFPFQKWYIYSNVPYPVSAAFAAPPPRPAVTLPITSGSVYSMNPDLKLPYTLQWNIALEQSLGTQQSLSLSYVAAAARRLLNTQVLNTRVGYTSGDRPNPNFANMYYTTNGPTSDYQSLQVQYKARVRRALQALVNYTWSHAIDEVSNEYTGYVLERGNSNFDVRHNFSAAISYNLPVLNAGQVLTRLFRDWSVDGVVHAQTGRPVDVTSDSIVVDSERLSVRPDVIPGVPLYISDPTVPGGRRFNSAAFRKPPVNPTYSGIVARQGTFGRNIFRELPLYQADLALGRSFRLSEVWKLQFKAEAFNVFNHPMFGSYGTSYTSPSTFGVPSTTLNRAYGGLSALYQMGGPRSMQFSLRLSF